jgi:uncharacterized protein
MLRRTHVEPFLRKREGRLEVSFLQDPQGRIAPFLDRLCRLVKRLEGRPRRTVQEALRRQERRVRDVRRLSGISKSLLDACRFQPPRGAEGAEEVREALFRARGQLWPPVPGDSRLPYQMAADTLGIPEPEVDRLLYADDPMAHVLVRAPRMTGPALLDRYNLDLARGVLLNAVEMTVTAKGGWKRIFRAVKLARLMYRIEPAGRSRHRVHLSGPAAPYLARPQRYGDRFVRVIPALVHAPGWRLDALVEHGEERLPYALGSKAQPIPRTAPTRRGRRPRYDSSWEKALATDFAAKLGEERRGWTLVREETPVALGQELFLPDFTLRHRDGREALVEIVGFWTPDYLERKVRQVEAAGMEHLVLVVYRGLAAGEARPEPLEAAAPGRVLWFANKPRIGPVLEAAERVARHPSKSSD